MTKQNSIPKIIHQTWKSKNPPRRFRRFQKTWLHHHPHWEYRLWSDADNRDFIARCHAWFLPIYDAYPEPIMRADAARYFILLHYGGVYADLDCQCLRPVDDLLRDCSFVASLEPPEHAGNRPALDGGVKEILCNAFLASTPGHGFWDEVINSLVLHQGESSPLDATGPFMLSRAYKTYPRKDEVCIKSHEFVCPVDNSQRSRVVAANDYPNAFMVHHWSGTWWRRLYLWRAYKRKFIFLFKHLLLMLVTKLRFYKRYLVSVLVPKKADFLRLHCHISSPSPYRNDVFSNDGNHLPCTIFRLGQRLAHTLVDERETREYFARHGYPRVSCLLVTYDRFDKAKRSIRFFMRQTWPNKELLVVCDHPSSDLENWVKDLNRTDVRYLRLPAAEKNLGELRNFSVQRASGDYVCQWDDDDFFHARRLQYQMASLTATDSDACFLHRQIFWLPEVRRLGVFPHDLLENTLLCKKEKAPAYLSIAQGEDSKPCQDLLLAHKVVFCDRADLYVYLRHGGNVWHEKHFMDRWARCRERYEGVRYDWALAQLSRLYDYDFGHRQLPLSDRLPASGTFVSDKPAERPSLLVLVPAKNVAPRLAQFVKNIEQTAYPRDRLSLAILESDSNDGSYERIKSLVPRLQKRCARVELFKKDFDYQPGFYPRWHLHAQYKRRQILAKSRNLLLYRALRDEEWVLWIDADVQYWPADVIDGLLNCGKEIVVPNCVRPDGSPFDLNTFILEPGAERLDWARHIYDGLLQPPAGFGRSYLGDHKDKELVEVHGVGATMLLVHADLHRQGLNFPAFPLHYYIETEGLAEMARCMGCTCWGLPKVEIVHGNY